MVLTVLLPSYFPSAKKISKALAADVVVLADSFLFQKGPHINRLKIKTASGPTSLTIPVFSKGKGQQQIRNVDIDNHGAWQISHWKNIQNNYQNAPYFYYFEKELVQLYNSYWENLNDILEKTFSFLKNKIGLQAELRKSSELPAIFDRSTRILKWAEYCNCDSYLVDKEELSLIDLTALLNNGLLIQSFQYKTIPYHQQFANFVPNLSALDVLFNEGELSKTILLKGIIKQIIYEEKND
jgi:hypothetical protein